jgi:N-acyl-D-amino-acid deacylase
MKFRPVRLLLPLILCTGLVAFHLPQSRQAGAQQAFDVIIVNGRVLDGTGTPWIRADVAVRGDRIAAVGDLSGARAARTIDATGLYVAPGFIDTHVHAETLTTPELSGARPFLAQGITTVFVNPDGGGDPDIAGQQEALARHGLGVNVAQLIGQGAIRRVVLGQTSRAPSHEELERMRGYVRAGMEAGAFGLSTGLFYPPGVYATTEEVIELAHVVAPWGGVYQSHPRDEADYTIGVVAATDEVIRVAEEAGIPGIVTHIKVLGPRVWGYSAALVHRIEQARERGVEIFADQYPYDASATGLSAALVPAWAADGGRGALLERMADPEQRARLRADMAENLDRRGGAERIQFRRHEPDPRIEGRSLAALAEEAGVDPIDAALALLQEGSPSIVSFNMHENDIVRFMRQPWTMTASDGQLVAMGEGVPHPRGYGAFPRKIRKYVLEQNVIDLAFAIRSMTGMPASVYRIADRGVIRQGAYADLVVFDLDRVNDPATYTAPHQLAEGMIYVMLNGAFAIDEGRFTEVLHGRVLRRSPRLEDS